MKTQYVDFEGNFGSQDPTLQPTAEDFARLSEYLQTHRRGNEKLIAEARRVAARQPSRTRQKTAV